MHHALINVSGMRGKILLSRNVTRALTSCYRDPVVGGEIFIYQNENIICRIHRDTS